MRANSGAFRTGQSFSKMQQFQDPYIDATAEGQPCKSPPSNKALHAAIMNLSELEECGGGDDDRTGWSLPNMSGHLGTELKLSLSHGVGAPCLENRTYAPYGISPLDPKKYPLILGNPLLNLQQLK